ncbi:hypothetical protein FOZ63_003570 [Perkinsus olseni]|uniref:J domain-containing protein n=1 Tax=Perkinsus olseni TaxID=32597 RepID=A0A7J6UQE2_PEROL|nr:hypothetical protein FOZ63_003570 [Perkinsus olseni]
MMMIIDGHATTTTTTNSITTVLAIIINIATITTGLGICFYMPCGLLRCYWSKMPPRTPRPSSSSSVSGSCSSSSSKIADYYNLLGVSSDASIDDIRHAFYDICRRYHPDKVTPKNTKEKEKENNNTNHSSNNNTDEMIKTMTGDDDDDDDDATLGKGTNTTTTTTTTTQQQQHSASALEHWTAIQAAWKCLSNDTKRIIYDIRREGRMVTEDDSNRLLLLLKAQAKRDIDNMQHEYHRILKREKKRNGVIIIKAIFGNLTPKDGNQHHHHQQDDDDDDDDVGVEGPYIDVTLPLQCTVDTHKVILAAGLAKSDIPGFYNPIPLHLQQQYGRDADGTSMEAASLYVV